MALFFCPGIVLIYTMVKNAAPELRTFRPRQRWSTAQDGISAVTGCLSVPIVINPYVTEAR